MNVSFGICLSSDYNVNWVQSLVNSIKSQEFGDAEYEIIFIGQNKGDIDVTGVMNVMFVDFDESVKRAWITRKKNLLAKYSRYDIVCILHDYYFLGNNWYSGLKYYNSKTPNWNVLSNRVHRFEGDRHADWVVNQKYMDQVLQKHPELGKELMDIAPKENNGPRWVCALPYSESELSHIQYISGGYILTRKKIIEEIPFDEKYGWGEAAEDIIWSEEVIDNGYRFNFNPFSDVFLQKPAKWLVYQMNDKCVNYLKEMFPDDDRIQ